MGWLAGVFEWFIDAAIALWPISIARYDEWTIRTFLGRKPVILNPGAGLYWNVLGIHESWTIGCLPFRLDLPEQYLDDIEGVAVQCGGMIYLQVWNPYLAETESDQ